MAKKKARKNNKAEKLIEAVIEGIQEKKGEGITTINLKSIESAVCDYFVICHGNSDTQVESIADSVKEVVKNLTGEKPINTEGKDNAEWILMDYFNVIVHIFKRETRDFYKLEALWADAEVEQVSSQY